GDPEAGVSLQPHELPPVQPQRAVPQAGGHPGAEGWQLAPGHRQHPHVHVPAQPLPPDCPAPSLLPGLHHQRHDPRLDPRYRVLMFEHALTADEANRKYSYKGLVAEALRQLVGEECYRQDEVLPPGYCTGQAALRGVLGAGALGRQEPCSCLAARGRRAGAPGHDPKCFQGGQAVPEEPGERSPPASEATGPPPSPCRPSPKRGPGEGLQGAEEIQRVVLSVNDKWHYCQNSDILVGSRAMRDRHLRLLGYSLVQLPYTELEKVSGIEEAKHYLRQKLRELRF
ncbi:Fas-activated serine/threonine kinase, partial [Columba livia]